MAWKRSSLWLLLSVCRKNRQFRTDLQRNEPGVQAANGSLYSGFSLIFSLLAGSARASVQNVGPHGKQGVAGDNRDFIRYRVIVVTLGSVAVGGISVSFCIRKCNIVCERFTIIAGSYSLQLTSICVVRASKVGIGARNNTISLCISAVTTGFNIDGTKIQAVCNALI